MAYQTITAKAAGDVLTASYINTYYKGNIEWLLNGKQVQQLRYAKTSNYTTSSTSWADVDATNLKLTLSSNFITGRVDLKATFFASISFSGGSAPYNMAFDIYDSTANVYLSSGTSTPLTNGCLAWGVGTGAKVKFSTIDIPEQATILGSLTGLAAGTHDLKLRWKVDNASATATIYADTISTYMGAIEF